MHYSIATRQAEERIIPAAVARGTAVAVNMPLEEPRGCANKLVQGRPLPDFAKEFGAETWSAFFLKWVISNPAITVALPRNHKSRSSLGEPHGGHARSPTRCGLMRKRMVAYMETIPGFTTVGNSHALVIPGKNYLGVIAQGQAAIRNRG